MNEKITQLIGKVKLGTKKNAPELLLGGALVTGTATIIYASKATLKAKDLKSDLEVEKMEIEYSLAGASMSTDEAKKEVKKVYLKYALSLSKEYAIPTALYAATVALVFSSYKIQKNRQVALSSALAVCTTAYTTLINKLKNGAEHRLTAEEVMNGLQGREVIDPETGEVTIEKVQEDPVCGLYEARFDRYSTAWENDKFQNESTLRSEENWANDRLRLQGYVFLNDIYDRLGLPRTKAGQIVGWISNGNGDNFVDFGIKDCEQLNTVGYDTNAFDLNFNVDGDILCNF